MNASEYNENRMTGIGYMEMSLSLVSREGRIDTRVNSIHQERLQIKNLPLKCRTLAFRQIEAVSGHDSEER